MTAKEYLSQIRTEQAKIKNLEDAIEKLEAEMLPKGSRTDADKVQGNSHKSLESDILRLNKYQEIYEKEKKAKEEIVFEIVHAINEIDDSTSCRVLYEKWVNGRKVKDIAKDLHYDESYLRSFLYPKALAKLQEVLDKKKNNGADAEVRGGGGE